MAGLLSYASESHRVWSKFAAKIHKVVWGRGELEKVQEFVRQWATEFKRQEAEVEQAQADWRKKAKQLIDAFPERYTRKGEGFVVSPFPLEPLPGSTCVEVKTVGTPIPADLEYPLPLSHRKRSPAEKWAVLVAIHDTYLMDGDKINPLPEPIDERDLSAYTKWGKEGGTVYSIVVDRAKELSKADKPDIARWLKELVADAAKAPADPPKADAIEDTASALAKGVAPRRAKFLEWYKAEGDTYHSHAAIRDKWNNMSKEQQVAICPGGTGKVTRDGVIQDIKRAKVELNEQAGRKKQQQSAKRKAKQR